MEDSNKENNLENKKKKNSKGKTVEIILLIIAIIIFIIQLFIYFEYGTSFAGHIMGSGISSYTGIYGYELSAGYMWMWLHFLCSLANIVIIIIGKKFGRKTINGFMVMIYIMAGLCFFGSLLYAFAGCNWAVQ